MPRFRPRTADELADTPLSPEAVRWLAAEVVQPCHFFAAPALTLEWEHREDEESAWEIFQGRLLDPAHTRERRSFTAWNVYRLTPEGRSGEPLLALKWDRAARQLHVVRGVEGYVWEGYDSGGGVILSRERRKWVRELVGTAELALFRDLEELRDELICLLFNAVVGTSRLPLAPVETPVPAFSFGELFYGYRPGAAGEKPLRTCRELIDDMLSPALSWRELAKWLELFLRAVPWVGMYLATQQFLARWEAIGRGQGDLVALLRTMFNEVSLSPYTDWVPKTLAFLWHTQTVFLRPGDGVDFLGHLLRQNGRHLTAYDLVTFHHRGANYPDALLLEAVLKDYLRRAAEFPQLFLDQPDDSAAERTTKRLRRRALRQGWLHRRAAEGLAVPEVPTSPGENQRVLPPSHPRVDEEQITQPAKRTKQLFADTTLPEHWTRAAADVLRQSLTDLEHPDELRELGMALYLDRPLNAGKPPAEPDGTLLFSAEAFSRAVARRRMQQLRGAFGELADAVRLDVCLRRLEELPIRGLSLDRMGSPPRPGVLALTDARLASADFVFLRTTAGTVRELLALYDFAPLRERFGLDWLGEGRRVLLARAARGPGVILYDEALRPRVELQVPAETGYVRRGGREFAAAGLWAVRVWGEEEGAPPVWEARGAPIVLPPR